MGRRQPMLALTRLWRNPLFRNPDDGCKQLIERENYRPDPLLVRKAITARDTVVIDLTKLRLAGDDILGYLSIDTTSSPHRQLNKEERKLAERVYGRGEYLTRAMLMLRNVGIKETRIYVLRPDYVRCYAADGPIGRVSMLNSYPASSDFFTTFQFPQLPCSLYAVRRQPIPASYFNPLITHPEEAVAAMNDRIAANLAGLIQRYLTSRERQKKQ
jgi:hypothetical protein